MEKETENNSFAFYMKEIDRVVAEMEKGGIDQLDSLIENFEYGSALIEKCNKILKEAELKVQKISARFNKENIDESK